jgi:hypothetical protein
MIRYLGAPPKSFLQLCRYSDAFFDEHGEYRLTSILYDFADVFEAIGGTERQTLSDWKIALRRAPRARNSSTSCDVLYDGIPGKDHPQRNYLNMPG